jgi:hypothetical protein
VIGEKGGMSDDLIRLLQTKGDQLAIPGFPRVGAEQHSAYRTTFWATSINVFLRVLNPSVLN